MLWHLIFLWMSPVKLGILLHACLWRMPSVGNRLCWLFILVLIGLFAFYFQNMRILCILCMLGLHQPCNSQTASLILQHLFLILSIVWEHGCLIFINYFWEAYKVVALLCFHAFIPLYFIHPLLSSHIPASTSCHICNMFLHCPSFPLCLFLSHNHLCALMFHPHRGGGRERDWIQI